MEAERSSSFSDWESVRDEDAGEEDGSRQSDDHGGRVVLELPPEGLAGASGAAVANEASGAEEGTSASGSSLSSFVPVSRFDNMTVSAVPPSAASSYRYPSSTNDGDDPSSSSSLSNFELLSLSSGEVVRKCHRCRFHNSHDSAVCAACDLALVANPNVDADAQIAMHLQQKEEADARARLQELERKRERIRSHPLYEHGCILANDVREARASGDFYALPEDDLAELALRFVQKAMDQSAPKEIAFVYKCTPHATLEAIRANGLPADRPVVEMATDVEVGRTLEEAFDSFETLGMMSGEPLRPIPEDGEDGAEKPKPCCLCWIVAVVRSAESPSNANAFPPAQTLPLAYFDSSYDDEGGRLDQLLDGLKRVFTTFFVENLQLSIVVVEPPRKKIKLGSTELVQQEDHANFWREVGGASANDVEQPAVEPSPAWDSLRDEAMAQCSSWDNLKVAHRWQQMGGDHPVSQPSHKRDFQEVGLLFQQAAEDSEKKMPAATSGPEPSTTQPDHEDAGCRHVLGDGPDASISRSEDEKPEPSLEKEDTEIVSDEHAPTMPLRAEDRVTAIVVFGSGLALCCNDQDILFWNDEWGVYRRLEGAGVGIVCLASHNGELLATGSMRGDVAVHNLHPRGTIDDDSTSVLDSRLQWQQTISAMLRIMDLCFLPKGKAVAATNMMRECQLWNVENGSCICTLKGDSPETLRFLAWRKIELASSRHDSYQEARRLQATCFSPDGNCLASVADGSPSIHFWDLKSNKTRQLLGHESTPDHIGRPAFNIRALSFSPDGKFLASAANDCTIRIWDRRKSIWRRICDLQKEDSPCVNVIRVPHAIGTLDFSPDSTLIAGGCVNGDIRIWAALADSNEALRVINGSKGSIRTLVFLPDGKTLASVGWSECSLKIWNWEAHSSL